MNTNIKDYLKRSGFLKVDTENSYKSIWYEPVRSDFPCVIVPKYEDEGIIFVKSSEFITIEKANEIIVEIEKENFSIDSLSIPGYEGIMSSETKSVFKSKDFSDTLILTRVSIELTYGEFVAVFNVLS